MERWKIKHLQVAKPGWKKTQVTNWEKVNGNHHLEGIKEILLTYKVEKRATRNINWAPRTQALGVRHTEKGLVQHGGVNGKMKDEVKTETIS